MNKTILFENFSDSEGQKTNVHFYHMHHIEAAFSPVWTFGNYVQSEIVNDKIIIITKGNEPIAGVGDAGYLCVFNMDGSIHSSFGFAATGVIDISMCVTQDNKIIIKDKELVYVFNFDCVLLNKYPTAYNTDLIVGNIGNMYLTEHIDAGDHIYTLHDIRGNMITELSTGINKLIFTTHQNPMQLWYANTIDIKVGIVRLSYSPESLLDIDDSTIIPMDTIRSIREGEGNQLYVLGIDSGVNVITVYGNDLSFTETIDIDILPTTNVVGFDIDDLGRICVYGDNGIYVYDRVNGEYVWADGSLNTTPGVLTIPSVGGFESPTNSSSFKYLRHNTHLEKVAVSDTAIESLGKGNTSSGIGMFPRDIVTVSKARDAMYAIYGGDPVALGIMVESAKSVEETIPVSSTLVVTTESTTGVSASGTDIYATFNGTIVSLGATDPTQHGFVYGENPAPELNPPDSDSYDTYQGAVSVVGPYTSTDTGGLLLNSTYYVRAYAVDIDSGRVYGNEVTFDTPDCTEAYNDGYDNGYNAGCEDGDDDLYGESGCGGDYSQGWQDGHDDRTMEIYDEGYDSFVDCVTLISNPYDGCSNGWDTEFEDGWNDAYSDAGC